jgi:MoaA/NifB/PqqE/SkfB family radical SAM enzyme
MNIFSGNRKLLAHLDRVAAWQQGEVIPPVVVEFDLTGRCNHKCPRCCGGYRVDEMYSDEARKYLLQIADYGARGMIFSGGGDPLLHPDCASLVEYTREHGPEVVVMTNGSTMTETVAHRLALVCSGVRISIDAATPDVYREVHGVGSDQFKAAWNAVRYLASSRDAQHASCLVGVGYLVGEKSLDGMAAAARMAREAGADYIQIRPYHEEAVSIAEQLAACCELQTDVFHVYASEHKYARMDRSTRDYSTCHGSAFTAVVQADANLVLCCHLRGRPEWYLGNLRRQSFQDIWELYRRPLLKKLDVSKCFPVLCRNDSLNAFLEVVSTPPPHAAFL